MGFKHFFSRKKSREIAKDRLKILLISDRVNCSPEMMEMIKTDIAKVISKYMQIDTKSMKIQNRNIGIQCRHFAIMPFYSDFGSSQQMIEEVRIYLYAETV